MSKLYFVDTSYLVALLNTRDQWHRSAIYWKEQISQNHILLLTTDYILIELADGLSSIKFRKEAGDTILTLQNSRYISIIHSSQKLLDMGLNLYRERIDKEWSLTDCISIITMELYNITEVLSSDKHFIQAGFNLLLRKE
jgi:predicted nucleic acid-binding protein